MMTINQLRAELEMIARDLELEEAEVEAEQNGKWIHLLIAAKEFRGKSQGERENMIWRAFERRFDDETILAITQCYLLTPEERAAFLSTAS